MADYGREVRSLLSKNGCYFLRPGKGSHDIWDNKITGKQVTVFKNIKSRHTANDILSDAGINHKF